MRRLALLLVALAVVAGCSADDDGPGGTTTTATAPATSIPTTSPTLPPEVADDFEADDVGALCADLEALADIDPDVDPTQAQVDRLREVAETAPSGVAEPLATVADFGQAIVDGDPDGPAMEEAAAGAALLIVAYGNDACGGIVVPLFNRLSGYS